MIALSLRSAVLVAVCSIVLALAGPAPAATIDQTGPAGAAGSAGAAGDPGEDGGPGGPGESLDILLNVDATNTVKVSGGAGGAGGSGGAGDVAGADGGDGGNGGDGGDARAQVSSQTATTNASAIATAVGGRGGAAGARGTAGAGGVDGARGTPGLGGSAEATAFASSLVGTARAVADVTGGLGGYGLPGSNPGSKPGGGAGRDGTDVALVDAVSGSSPLVLFLEQHATGGRGGQGSAGMASGRSGDASSLLTASNPGGGRLEILSEATGAAGAAVSGSTGARGGDALAGAIGIASDPAGRVDVTARATGGGGVSNYSDEASGGNGGTGSLGVVSGTSPAGRVSVLGVAEGGSGGEGFNGGAGGDAHIVDAVDGSTGGLLLLTQEAIGGRGGGADRGAVGAAGDASSSLTRTAASARLQLTSRARGGRSGSQDRSAADTPLHPGGDATAIGDGTNTKGSLSVVADATAGWGGVGAAGTAGGNAQALARGHGEGTGEVTVSAAASGGRGGKGTRAGYVGGDGGSAAAEASGESTTSPRAQVTARASGGNGGEAGGGAAGSGDGGGATVHASATTFHDGQTVDIGSVLQGAYGAFGGAGGTILANIAPTSGGAGGDAVSESIGIALGDSEVTVRDLAQGGAGGTRTSSDIGVVTPGRGGDARSRSIATGGGRSLVSASSLAVGGLGPTVAGAPATPSGVDGEAHAFASATGLGAVEAVAQAAGVDPTANSLRDAQAIAISSVGPVGRVESRVASSRGSAGVLQAVADVAGRHQGAFLGTSTGFGPVFGLAYGQAAPAADALALWIDEGSALDARIDAGAQALAVGSLGLSFASDDFDGRVRFELSQPGSELLLGLDHGDFGTTDFGTLVFTIEIGGVLFLEQSFTDAATATAFFDDAILPLGVVTASDVELGMRSSTASATALHQFDFVLLAVPEPGSGALLGLGLAWLACRRRSD